MRKLLFTVGMVAAVMFATTGVMAATTDLFPGTHAGWGIPGVAPHGNGGGWPYGTTQTPLFVDGTSAAPYTSPGDGRGSVWWGNDGGAFDALIGSSETAGPGGTNLYQGTLLSSVSQLELTTWRNSTAPGGGLVAPTAGGMLLWMRDGAGGALKFARVIGRMIHWGQMWENGSYTGGGITSAYNSYPNDQWVTWTIPGNLRMLEFTGNAFGSTADFWDGTGSPNGKMVSLNQLATALPNLQFDNTGWPNAQAVEITNNVFGSTVDQWYDKFSFTFGAAGAPPTPADGDFNSDGIVNILDLSTLSGNWQSTGVGAVGGDANGDGIVNILDLSTLSGNWQATSIGGGGTTDVINFTTSAGGTSASLGGVPEPATLMLLAAGGGLMVLRRRR